MSRPEVTPARWAWRGLVEAQGVIIEGAPGLDLRRRLVASWRAGSQVMRLGMSEAPVRLAVLWPVAELIRADEAPGAVLSSQGGCWWAAPPPSQSPEGITAARERGADEVQQAPMGSICLVAGGRWQSHQPGAHGSQGLSTFDPSLLLDLQALPVAQVKPLGPTPAPRAVEPPRVVDTRTLFGERAPAQAEAQRKLAAAVARGEGERPGRGGWRSVKSAARSAGVLGAMTALGVGGALRGLHKLFSGGRRGAGQLAGPTATSGAVGRGGASGGSGLNGLSLGLGLLLGLVGVVASAGWMLAAGALAIFLGGLGAVGGGRPRGQRGQGEPGQGSPEGQATSTPPPEPGWLNRLSGRLRQWMNRSRFGRRLRGQQGEYLREMVELFERGRLDEALRHAVPLSETPGDRSKPGPLGVPRPRSELQLTLGRPGQGGGSVTLFDGDFDYVRSLYRRAFERLVEQGAIDKAAFVLAELLDAAEEAVAFLEKHGQLKLAAELAEGRQLPPPQVVRQWILAGDIERACMFARRHAVWWEAIALLEPGHDKAAQVLRLKGADVMAEAGDFAQAVNLIWPIESARPVACRWLWMALDTGGMLHGRSLARLVGDVMTRGHDLGDDLKAELVKLLDLSAPVDGPRREALMAFHRGLEMVLDHEGLSPARLAQLKALLKAAIRVLLLTGRAGESMGQSISNPQGRRMVKRHPLMQAEWPSQSAWPEPPRLVLADPARTWHLGLASGPQIHEVVRLPSNRWLVALGEAGLWMLTPDGRPIMKLRQPAQRLVPSDNGSRVLALARRGDAWQVTSVDLIARTANSVALLKLSAWAHTFSGDRWMVGMGRDAVMLDPLGPDRRPLWAARDLEGQICAVGRPLNPGMLCWCVQSDTAEMEIWQFSEGQMQVTRRTREVMPAEMAAHMPNADHDELPRWLSTGYADGVAMVPMEPMEQQLRWRIHSASGVVRQAPPLEAPGLIPVLSSFDEHWHAAAFVKLGMPGSSGAPAYHLAVARLGESNPRVWITGDGKMSEAVRVERGQVTLALGATAASLDLETGEVTSVPLPL